MSPPQIPKLTTLRRGGLRNRGRGGGLGQDGQPRQSKDEIVQNTDTDAATSRLSAVEAGYLIDPFAKLLSTQDQTPKRLPLMNRGKLARTTAIDRIVDTFVSAQPFNCVQVISLGAGSDTRFFRLQQQRPDLDLRYHELDFATNTKAKIARLQDPTFNETTKQLSCDLTDVEVSADGTQLRSASYYVHAVDLRTLVSKTTPLRDLDTRRPTLLISECCLIYLSPDHADAVLQYFTRQLTRALAIVIYEPIRPFDSFGRTMVSNLTARGIQLQTLEKYADLREQRERLEQAGFAADGGGAQAADVDFIWREWVNEKEKERIDGLEWMDEVEEFVLLGKHYCVAWGWRGFPDGDVWKALPAPAH
jgi:O-methyltransferase involved in polyketide biosynthesis